MGLHNRAAQQPLLPLLLSGGRGDGGKAREGVGTGGRPLALLVGAGTAGCCSNGCAASLCCCVDPLLLKENKNFYLIQITVHVQ